MNISLDLYVITALLPIAAMMVVFQTNPYHALVIRGMLGVIAALTYSVLGAPDVALTEALVGTLLAITLYAVAVRSSLVLILGMTQADMTHHQETAHFKTLLADLKSAFQPYSVRIKIQSYNDSQTLHQALTQQEIHAILEPVQAPLPIVPQLDQNQETRAESSRPSMLAKPFKILVRVSRVYDIMASSPISTAAQLTYESDANPSNIRLGASS